MRRFVRGVSNRTQGYYEKAGEVEEGVIEKPRKSMRAAAIDLQKVRSLLRTGEKMQALGKVAEAERLYIQALTVLPEDHAAQTALAKFYYETDRLAKAEALFREMLSREKDTDTYVLLGHCCRRLRKYECATDAYTEAIERDPKNPDLYVHLGRSFYENGQVEEAAPILEKASQWAAKDTELLRILADSYERLQLPQNALHAYERINRLEPYDQEIKDRMREIGQMV